IRSRVSLNLPLPRPILNPRNSNPWAMCTIRVFSPLSVTPSVSRILPARAKACSASARVRQVTTQSSAQRVSRYPFCLISLSKGVSRILLNKGEMTPPLRGSSWSLESLTLCLVARLQHLLNELQHAAVGDLLSEESPEEVPRLRTGMRSRRAQQVAPGVTIGG